MDPAIERRVKASLASEIKSGRPAESCRYRFKALPDRAPDGVRDEFAIAVLALAAVALGSLKWAPALRWYAAAGPGEKADYGADDFNGDGFMEPEDGSIWIRDDVPAHRLPEIVAHETCHAIKHRGQANSTENAAEAYAFGDRFGELFGVPDYSGPEIFVVESRADLPYWAYPGSRAWAKGELALYEASHRGIPRAPRWFCEWRLDGAKNVYEGARSSAAVAWIEELLDRHVLRSE